MLQDVQRAPTSESATELVAISATSHVDAAARRSVFGFRSVNNAQSAREKTAVAIHAPREEASGETRTRSGLGRVSIETHAIDEIESSAHVHPSLITCIHPRGTIATLRIASPFVTGHPS